MLTPGESLQNIHEFWGLWHSGLAHYTIYVNSLLCTFPPVRISLRVSSEFSYFMLCHEPSCTYYIAHYVTNPEVPFGLIMSSLLQYDLSYPSDILVVEGYTAFYWLQKILYNAKLMFSRWKLWICDARFTCCICSVAC